MTETAAGEDVFVLPASYAQQRLWFIDQVEPGRPTYNVPLNLRFAGALDVPALARALTLLVERHETLRTVFDAPDGQAAQVILPPTDVSLPIVDLRDVAADARDAEVLRRAREEGNTPFDLRAGPMVRATLLRTTDDEHVLLLTFHHIAVDGWSLGIVQRELRAAYAAYATGAEPQLAELAIQYADYAAWQRERLDGGGLEAQYAYWTERLAAPLPVLELPTDRPYLPGRERNAESAPVLLPVATSAALGTLARDAGVTPFVLLLAAFQVLLHRYTGQDDVIVGSPVAGRTRKETEGIVGLFVNTLALRTDLSGAPSFRALLARVRDTVHGALAHQDVPFERLVELVQPERDRARNPVFQALFSFQDFSEDAPLALPGVTVSRVSGARATAKFDVQLIMSQRAGALRGSLEYDASLLDAATAQRMMRHFETLLGAIAAAPDTPIGALSLMDDAERRQVVETFNATGSDYPRDATVPALFAEQVARAPGARAVVSGGMSLTYAQLDERSDALATQLVALGVGPGTLVGLSADRSLALVVAILGMLKAGGAYVPLDPAYPAARLGFMLADTRAPVVLVHRHLAGALDAALAAARESAPDLAPRVLTLDDDGRAEDASGHALGTPLGIASAEPRALAAPDAAYVMYTSGSTGRPKGVLVPHRAIVRLVRDTNFAHFGPDDVMLGFAPTAFDASTLELWGPLLNGGRLVLAPSGMPELSELGALVAREGVTTLWLTAALFQQVVDGGLAAYRGVRQLLAGGDVLSVPHVRRALAELPACRLINGYGPTENTTFTCCFTIPHDWPADAAVPIGVPVAHTSVYVLDPLGAPVPVGVPGELYAGGDGVALGYLDRPELTAERFVPDPFSKLPNARMYRTGDRVRWRADGVVEFLGRIDQQVKIRGFRIEPGEVEAVLGAHPAVREAAVVARRGAGAVGVRLLGYYVPRDADALPPDELRAYLRERLPEYMVPAALVPLAALPVGATGKVDRQALPEPVDAGTGTSYVPPRTTLEHQLVHIWEQLLSRHPIGIRDDFFELGGHSLLAVQMFAEIERVSGKRPPLASLFEGATIEALAARVEAAVQHEPEPPVVVLQAEGAATPLVVLHGDVRGGGWYCRRLAPLLGTDVPMIVLPTVRPGADGVSVTVEGIAAHHVAELRKVQPSGPYRIAGYCAGGMIAYEMACQLREAGETIEHMILIDTVAGNARFRRFGPIVRALSSSGAEADRLARRARILRSLRYYSNRIRKVRQLDVSAQIGWIARNVRRRLPGLATVDAPPQQTWAAPTPEFLSRPATELLQLQGRAAGAYIPRPFDGPVELVVAADVSTTSADNVTALVGGQPAPELRAGTRGWQHVARDVRVHPIATTHVGLITDALPTLADRLRAILGLTPD